MNDRIRHAIGAALSAVVHLDMHGCTVRGVEIGDRRPVIAIDPPSDAWIHGGMHRRETVNGVTRAVMAAPFHGCQVEWVVTENRDREAMRA